MANNHYNKFYFYSVHVRKGPSETFDNAVIKGMHPYCHVHGMNLGIDTIMKITLISWQEITEEEYNQFMKLDE